MHLSHLLLSLILLLPLIAASPPPLHDFRFPKNRHHRLSFSSESPQEYIEVTRPLPFNSLTPSCTLPLLSHSFANTVDLPPASATYSPPPNCTWTNAVLHFSATSNGSQYDRIAGVWLSGAELLRTSTPEPTPDGIFWSFKKDVTKYSSLLRQSNLSLSVMLENVVNEVYTGIYRVNLTLLYYDVASNSSSNQTVNIRSSLYRHNQKSTIQKFQGNRVSLSLNKSLDLNGNPADLILPISSAGEEGFWFKIRSESDTVFEGIQIPLNTYRAVVEVYVSFHEHDEFWYTNPPDYYIETNGLTTKRGHGSYREVLVKLDNNVVGSVVPFPVVFTGGINPLFWDPVVSIGAFDLPSYEFEITPLLGMLLDGKKHYFGLGVADALPHWLVNANLHLWLDDEAERVQAGPIKYSDPSSCVERDSRFQQMDGKFEVEAERESEFSGWVNCSAGNFTSRVWNKLEFENTIKFKNNGTQKIVKQEVKVQSKVEIKLGDLLTRLNVDRKYPLKTEMTASPGVGKDNYLINTMLEHKFEEQKQIGQFESDLENKQDCNGWIFVQGHDLLSGSGKTSQNYKVKDSLGCYTRHVKAEGGAISDESENFLCAVAAS